MTKTYLSAKLCIFCLVLIFNACAAGNYPAEDRQSSEPASAPRYAIALAEFISITPNEIRIKDSGGEKVYIINEKTRYFDDKGREIAPTSFATGDSILINADIDGRAPVNWVKKDTTVKGRVR